jgi:AcrR family transcriptional regulator
MIAELMVGPDDQPIPECGELPSSDDTAKRRQVLEGARQAFLAMGFDGASMNDVARLAGVSKGTLYVYFPSKAALFEALIRTERRQQAEQLFRLEDDDRHVADVLHDLGVNFMQMMTAPGSIAHLRTVIAVAGKFPDIGRAFFEAGPQYGWGRLSQWLDRRVAEGRLSIPDTQLAAQQFFDLCQVGHLKPLLFGTIEHSPAEDIEKGVAQAVTLFMAGYGIGDK